MTWERFMCRRLVSAFCLLALLGGCTTLTPEERRALDEEECRSYGFRPGTDAFAECLQRIALDRRAEMRARRAALDDWPGPHVVYRPIIIARRTERTFARKWRATAVANSGTMPIYVALL